jgi:hypothetical protein
MGSRKYPLRQAEHNIKLDEGQLMQFASEHFRHPFLGISREILVSLHGKQSRGVDP